MNRFRSRGGVEIATYFCYKILQDGVLSSNNYLVLIFNNIKKVFCRILDRTGSTVLRSVNRYYYLVTRTMAPLELDINPEVTLMCV